jgi:phosphatidylserine decarboxylase
LILISFFSLLHFMQQQQAESYPGFGREVPIQSIQPGGGWGMRMELAWGKFRRWVLRLCFPSYVKSQLDHRGGDCQICPGRAHGCTADGIDSRDLKYFSNVCGYSFSGNDRYAWRRRLPFAYWGLAELIIFTIVCLVLGAGVGLLPFISVPVWLVSFLELVVVLFWLEIVWFFRDPLRLVATDPREVVSPADGTIVELAQVNAQGFPNDTAFRVGIFLSVFNVHINRSPISGVVKHLRYFPGRYLNALKTASARQNEQLWIDIERESTGMPVRVTQISGALARRIVCELKPGQQVTKGEKFGMIKLGSRTELYLPANGSFEVLVKLGQKVKGGETVLLRLKDSPEPSHPKKN